MATASPDKENQPSRTDRLCWRVACLVLLGAYLLSTPLTWQCEGVDEIEYLGLASSLHQGMGYTMFGAPYGYYPPAVPSLFSTLMRVDPFNWRAMYMLNAMFGATALTLFGSWMRCHFGPAGRWAAWFLLASYYPWSFSTRYLMSEPLFFLLSAIALILSWRILSCNQGRTAEFVVLAGTCLLAAVTRSAALSLTVGVIGAAAIRTLRPPRRTGITVAVLVGLLAFGFFAGWEIRAQRIDPDAAESYFRWAQKFLGVSTETAGIVARNLGEGVSGEQSTVLERGIICAEKLGQFVTSVARPSRNLAPLAFGLFGLFATGLFAHGRRWPWSPVAWYTLASLGMICMTSWVTSYPRYLYVLSPFLFLFVGEGILVWRGLLAKRVWWIAPAALGVWGLALTVTSGEQVPLMAGGEDLYRAAISLGCGATYLALIVGPLWVRLPGRPAQWLAAILIVYAAHTTATAGLRYRLTLQNHQLHQRNLTGAVDTGLWIAENMPADARCIAAIPRLQSFLSDRVFAPPSYRDEELDLHKVDLVATTGTLRNLPAFREAAEKRLQGEAERLVQAGRLSAVFASGDAILYTRTHPSERPLL